MSYSHDSSTPVHWATLLSEALAPADYEPSPAVLGDVAMSQVVFSKGATLRRTVTLYPSFVNGRAQGCASSSSFQVDADGHSSNSIFSCWFSFSQDATASDLATAIACAWQALK